MWVIFDCREALLTTVGQPQIAERSALSERFDGLSPGRRGGLPRDHGRSGPTADLNAFGCPDLIPSERQQPKRKGRQGQRRTHPKVSIPRQSWGL